MFPLQYRPDRVWRRTLGCLWIPAIIVLITVEDWLHVPQLFSWISIGVLLMVYLVVARLTDRKT
jgi:hypothetical protein